jgi:hypothetical protein
MKFLEGDALESEIDRFVEEWHQATGTNETLAEFLGFTEEEYALWVEQPQALRLILSRRKNTTSEPGGSRLPHGAEH